MLLLTLVATPVAYSLFDDAPKLRFWRWRRAPRAAVATASALVMLLPGGSTALAQTGTSQPPSMPSRQSAPGDNVLRLTRDDAIRLAVENNPDLTASRYDPAISAERVNAAKAAYVPTLQSGLQRNSQLQPATSLFSGTSGLETGTWSANTSIVQLMP